MTSFQKQKHSPQRHREDRTKSEFRNPKQIQNSKPFALKIWILIFRACFEIRASNFEFLPLCPLCLCGEDLWGIYPPDRMGMMTTPSSLRIRLSR